MKYDKDSVRKSVLDGLKPAIIADIRNEISAGKLSPSVPINFEEKWKTLRDPIYEHPLLGGAFRFLNITEDEVKQLLRESYIECGVELL